MPVPTSSGRSHTAGYLIVTDGEPSDVDVAERRYLVEDARHAVQELGHQRRRYFASASIAAATAI